jgi:hypothetical protein
MGLFRSYAKFKVGQQVFRTVRNAMRGRGSGGRRAGAGRSPRRGRL